MNVEKVICDCGGRLIRISAHNHDEKIPLGYYCPGCRAIQDTKREYLVPIDLITRMDPFFKTVSKREAYLAILQTGTKAIPSTTTDQKIETARAAIGSALVPFCRPAGDHETQMMERLNYNREMNKIFDKQIRAQEMKEAAASQPK